MQKTFKCLNYYRLIFLVNKHASQFTMYFKVARQHNSECSKIDNIEKMMTMCTLKQQSQSFLQLGQRRCTTTA